MWQKLFLTICILGSGMVFSQQAGKTSAIAMEFSAPSIAAYQQGSHTRVQDFYHYLGLLTTPDLEPGLKAQIQKNIMSLFADKHITITDPTAESPGKIPLQQFLDTVENYTKTTFTVVEMQSSPATFDDYWINSYTLRIETGTEITTRPIQQKIYFHPEQKEFGSTTREVWALRLGEIFTTN